MRVLLISTYDLGRQPFGLASPAAWLREAGLDVACVDLARERIADDEIRRADAIGFFLPMHTATRLALPVIARVLSVNPQARVIAYGLYAPLNEDLLRDCGVHDVLGGEFEQDLVNTITREAALKSRPTEVGTEAALTGCAGERLGSRTDQGLVAPPCTAAHEARTIPRLRFRVPAREGLLPLTQYASLQIAGEQRAAGYTEGSRGCKHRCRHCPIVPVYNGTFRIVAADIVLADVRAQVAMGARHITFGDPDFFNGIRHAEAILRLFAQEFPGISYDVTIKVEHLLRHADVLPVLHETGCAFVTTAVESVDDAVLEKLDKGHTRRDFERVVALCRDVGLVLAPTFVPFTPWTTRAGYLELLHTIDRLDLVAQVAPIQLAIRLLIPRGSRMLELDDVRAVAAPFDRQTLTHPWRHADPAVDALQAQISELAGVRSSLRREEVFARVWDLAHADSAAVTFRRQPPLVSRSAIPYLNEPWYC